MFRAYRTCHGNSINEVIELNIWLTLDCIVCSLYIFLEKWQTLAAAMIALCAAYSANKLIAAQIRQTKDLEDKKIEGLHTAYRASFALTLTKIFRYCQENSKNLKNLHQNIPDASNIKIADLPDTLDTAIERLISTSQNNNLTNLLVSLIRNLQIFDSRMHSLEYDKSNGSMTKQWLETVIRQCVYIHSICGPLMEYARFEDKNVPDHIDWSEYENSLSSLHYHENEFGDLFLEIGRLKLRGKVPDRY